MDDAAAQLVVDLVEKVGLLRRELEHQHDAERYAARLARIDQKVSTLADALMASNPTRAAALRTAWEKPARSLAFRNAAHQKQSR
jgi:hypothetical protein